MANAQKSRLFTRCGMPTEKSSSKRMDPKVLLEKSIVDQERLLNGIEVKGKKGVLIRSWFRDGLFMPAIGNVSLFGGKVIRHTIGEEKDVLSDFRNDLADGIYDEYIKAAEKKRQENADKLAQVRGKKK